jgi:hypothetical protein
MNSAMTVSPPLSCRFVFLCLRLVLGLSCGTFIFFMLLCLCLVSFVSCIVLSSIWHALSHVLFLVLSLVVPHLCVLSLFFFLASCNFTCLVSCLLSWRALSCIVSLTRVSRLMFFLALSCCAFTPLPPPNPIDWLLKSAKRSPFFSQQVISLLVLPCLVVSLVLSRVVLFCVHDAPPPIPSRLLSYRDLSCLLSLTSVSRLMFF